MRTLFLPCIVFVVLGAIFDFSPFVLGVGLAYLIVGLILDEVETTNDYFETIVTELKKEKQSTK